MEIISCPPHRLHADLEEPGDLRRRAASFAQAAHFRPLCLGQYARPPAGPSPLLRRLHAFACAFADPFPLELGDRGEDVEDEPPGRGRGVDILSERPEARPACADRLDDLQQVAQGPGETVVLRHHDHVTGAKLIEQPPQLGPVADGTADLVREDLIRTGGRQGVGLGIEVLVIRGDAGIADDHVPIVPKTFQNPKQFWHGFLARRKARISVRSRSAPKRTLFGPY